MRRRPTIRSLALLGVALITSVGVLVAVSPSPSTAGAARSLAPVASLASAADPRALTGYQQISGGGEHTCGIKRGGLYCWGRNTWGQVGTGTRGNVVSTPARVGTLSTWTSVAAGGATTCAIRGKKGRLFCWGLNNRGQLGDGTTKVSLKPKAVPGTGWSSVSAGWYHTCGIRGEGRLRCWGDNAYGELGRGHTRQTLSIARVKGTWRSVTVDGWTTCGIRSDKSLWCWGRNMLGQAGAGTWADRHRPALVGRARWNWRQVDLSWTHGCGVRSGGTAWCWGRNDLGGVGDGSTVARNEPVAVLGGATDVRSVSAYEGGACLLRASGRASCWGDNRYGQTGGSADYRVRPRARSGTYTAITSGWLHTCGLGVEVVCWGSNEKEQLARTTTRAVEPSTTGARRGDPLELRIATFNALGEHHSGPYRDADRFGPSRLRAEWMVRAIANQGLNVIAVQEASGSQVGMILRAGDGRLRAFPDPATSKLSTESTLFWDATRFTALKTKVIRTMFIKKKLPRPYVKLQDNATGRKFWVMAIHNAGWDMQRQRNQAMKDQLAVIEELEATGLPVFYLGDFNEKRTAFCKVLRRTGLDAASGGRLKRDGTCVPPRQMRVDWLFGSETGEWSGFAFDKSPMVRLTTDHWLARAFVRVP
ncbi:hypothetical protein [Nocardioides sp. YIM 152588]|uniref:RCC1 domain-containing protein n=1 Tax=Nocardioides sp. YIM 152588 TaxID=3158259 RepID=UPI0032E381B9